MLMSPALYCQRGSKRGVTPQKSRRNWYLALATGASANDPLFWPLHPIFDRVWAYMRLAPAYRHFNSTWVDTNSCNGHDYHDVLPFQNFLGENTPHFYTNEELFRLFDPSSPTMPYVYDNFKWDHCTGVNSSSAHGTHG